MSAGAVDVIVPCYNYGRYLRRCVESVLSAQQVAVRVLVIDDASSDDSTAQAYCLASGDSRVQVIRHAVNKGHIETYNEGLAWAQAPYLLLLSADDMVAPGALDRAVEVMEADPEIAFVHGRAVRFRREAELAAVPAAANGACRVTTGQDFIRQLSLAPVNPVETATALVRTAVQKRVGGYRKALPHAGDLEMWLRCAAEGKVAELDAVQGFTRLHDENMRHGYRGVEDYAQRRDALRMFFDGYAQRATEAPRLQAQAYAALAREILRDALNGLDKGRPWRPLTALACELDPAVRRDPLYAKIMLSRLLLALRPGRPTPPSAAASTVVSTRPVRRPPAAQLASQACSTPRTQPLISLILSTRDRGRYLGACLESLSALESRHPWELVLVDNGSHDETGALLAAFAARENSARRPVKVIDEPRPGLSHARNAGVRAARGEIFCFTDDDCYPEPNFIEAVAEVFADNDIGFMGGQIRLYDPQDEPVCITTRTTSALFHKGAFISTGEIQGACMAFRREIFEAIGLFDTALGAGGPLRGAEDCDMVARACLSGWDGGFFPDAVIYHHHRRRGAGAAAITYSSDYARGAFFAKLLVAFPAKRRLILKNWYWDTPVLVRPSRRSLSKVWRELRGALHYLVLHARAPTPRLA